jgi:hypothetical protein
VAATIPINYGQAASELLYVGSFFNLPQDELEDDAAP